MNRKDFYFGEVLDEADLDSAFASAETDVNNRALHGRTAGIVSGCQLRGYPSDSNLLEVSKGIVLGPQGQRIEIRDGGAPGTGSVGAYITVDSDGNSTAPGAGKQRWVTVAVRYGKTLSNPKTDDLSNTVYVDKTDSWNAQGTTNATDATHTANQAQDGGYAVDNTGLSLVGFYVVAGPAVTIGNPLTFPSVPSDAVILADVLYTDGDLGSALLNSAIYTGRQGRSSLLSPVVATIGSMKRYLLWEVTGPDYTTRIYHGPDSLEISSNCAWTPNSNGIGKWVADKTTSNDWPSTLYQFNYNGFFMRGRQGVFNSTPWTDSQWDTSATYSVDGVPFSDATLYGYVSLSLNGVSTVTAMRTAAQFSRQFATAPSTITFGAAGPSETNIGSVAGTNLSIYGFDFVINTFAPGSFIAQREYHVSI